MGIQLSCHMRKRYGFLVVMMIDDRNHFIFICITIIIIILYSHIEDGHEITDHGEGFSYWLRVGSRSRCGFLILRMGARSRCGFLVSHIEGGLEITVRVSHIEGGREITVMFSLTDPVTSMNVISCIIS